MGKKKNKNHKIQEPKKPEPEEEEEEVVEEKVSKPQKKCKAHEKSQHKNTKKNKKKQAAQEHEEEAQEELDEEIPEEEVPEQLAQEEEELQDQDEFQDEELSKKKKERKEKRHKKHKKNKKRKHHDNEDEIEKLEKEVTQLQQDEETNEVPLPKQTKILKSEELSEIKSKDTNIEPERSENTIKQIKKTMFKNEEVQKKRQEKKQRELEEKQEEESRLQSFNSMQREVYQKIKKAKSGRRRGGEDDEATNSSAQDLIQKMQEAVEADHQSNEQGKPAFKRLLLANEIYHQLRKIPIQEKFLECGGCKILEQWLDQMPDGTFPNINLVLGVLTCIDGLRVDVGHLEESKLAQVIQLYSEGIAGMPDVQKLAKQIVDKWSRLIFQIRTSYDAEGDFDTEYRNLQKRLERMRKQAVIDDDSDLDEDEETTADNNTIKKKSGQIDQKDQINIERGRAGIILPERNAFDFIERPERRQALSEDKRRDQESGKGRIQRTLTALKKQNLKMQYNKGLATVKLDY